MNRDALVHRSRRGAELLLLLLALVVGIGAYAAVGLGVEGKVPSDIFRYGGWLAALTLGAHLLVRFTAPYADPVLLPIVVSLNGLGLAEIHRIDLARVEIYAEATPYAGKQLVWMSIGIGLFALVLLLLRDHRQLQGFTYTAGLLGIGLLVLPMLPFLGREVNGARIWIHLGELSFQPGEAAKVVLAIAFASYLVVHRDSLALAGRRFLGLDLPKGRHLGPILLMWLMSLGILVFQRDLGSSLLFFGLFVVMLYVATERIGWLVLGGLLFSAGAAAAYFLFGYVRLRVDAWLNPFGDPQANGQIIQGMFGLAWGGLDGQGLGLGHPTLIPFSYSDFIMAALGEELGLTGIFAILLLYGLIVERALRTALLSRDAFGKLVATGLAAVFVLQVFVVIGGVTKLIPLTGLTTPFLSYGGSSLVANWVVIALLLRVSDQARRPLPSLAPDISDAETQVVMLR